ncbi:MAG: FMN-binding protein [Butyrivibrio sp.]|nr:FMN-binding protein [Butyrivibrio sp.]
MKLLISLLIVFIICMLFGQNIRKHAPVWYITVFVIGLLSMFVPSTAPMWLTQIITGYITRGTFATAMFIWVMYARVLPKGSKAMTTFMSLRAPLAIGAAMLILLHNAFYIIYYVGRVVKGSSMTGYEIIAGVCTLLMWVLLLPLTITSFMPVRRKMNPVKWKKLQRLSYIFYGLIYVHVCLLFTKQIIAGNTSYGRELAIYTAVFGFYLVERVALYLNMSKKAIAGNILVRIGEPVLAIVCAIIFFWPYMLESNAGVMAANSEKTEVLGAKADVENQEVSGVKADGEDAGISGDNASAESSEEVFANIVKDESITDDSQNEGVSYKDGEYTGSAMGHNGEMTVSVTIEGGVIAEVKPLASEDDDPYYTWVLKQIPGAIVEANSTDVDTVSGATISSKAMIKAVEDALGKAME